ncbi:thioredoxin domain-containing protein [Psychroserpens sp.]|uniref:thioredoxin domain-containing protein n=1 Tax=Psychroserpens sp. TaxID=2020870 RepID=UPI002B270390|nr:thioredoxin domain-containing protein [Psychroserpens sp.]
MKTFVYSSLLLILFWSCSNKNNSAITEDKPFTNDLINETSPYLLQHAYNPVDWKAWNSKSLQLAQEKNKLIIISVGYSACHWCHVMEEESFENDSVAKLMNNNFINIKVDREERPDVDQIYMNAVQLMTGSGGWPLNCIALPDGRPVFGGTYFTKTQWTKILEDMSDLYKNDPDKVIAYAEKLTQGVKNSDLITLNKEGVQFTTETLKRMKESWMPTLDFKDGGQKNAPKFPMPTNLDYLFRSSFQNDDLELQNFVELTLTKMANGGIYDQIGGGFSRYSVDERWHVPHFEKMLYDNAQLVSLYSKVYQQTGNEAFKTVIIETLNFIEHELTNDEGAFYSSIDADSVTKDGELEEGVFYTWTKEELQSILGNDFDLFKSYYNVNAKGKWENNHYILFKTQTDEEFIKSNSITLVDLNTKVSDWKSKLLKVRASRKHPRTDDKVLTSWNAMMLKAYIDAYRVLGDQQYLNRAIKNANFIKKKQLSKDGSLFHNYKNGVSTIDGFSEDYAHTIAAFIDLYQVTLNEDWLQLANEIMTYTIAHFFDKDNGMFYFTSDTETNLITRKIEVYDNVIPSSNSVLAHNLFKLSHYYSNKSYDDKAKQMLSNMVSDINKSPSAYSNWLNLYLNYSNPYYEVAISGSNAREKIKQLNNHYVPNILVAGATQESEIPIMKNRFIDDDTYIYVCVNGTCKLPVLEIEKAVNQLLK